MIGHIFSDDEDVICSANGWLKDQEQQFFYNGIRALEKCWTRCISAAEDSADKKLRYREEHSASVMLSWCTL